MNQYLVVGDTGGGSWYYDDKYKLTKSRFLAKSFDNVQDALLFFDKCDIMKEMNYKKLKLSHVRIDKQRLDNIEHKYKDFDLIGIGNLLNTNSFMGVIKVQELSSVLDEEPLNVINDICYYNKGDETLYTKHQAKKLIGDIKQ